MVRCVNIDWLEVYCIEDVSQDALDANFFRAAGWRVTEREYGTRVYKEVFKLYDNFDRPFIEIRRNPASTIDKGGGLFDPRSCHIKLSNLYCYTNNPIDILRDFLTRYNYQYKRLHRLDICYDFIRFDEGDDPQKFIDRYMEGRYAKVNQTNISVYGCDRWSNRVWQTVSWGKPSSMVSTKIYNKTLELEQVHDKPYIRQAWHHAGLIDDPISCTCVDKDGKRYSPNIWRVEFSLKSAAKRWIMYETNKGRKEKKEAYPHTLSCYDTRDKLITAFANLSSHYFRFKVFQQGVRKDRCRDKILFRFAPSDTTYTIDRLASHVCRSDTMQRLITRLLQYSETTYNYEVKKACSTVIHSIQDYLAQQYTASNDAVLNQAIATILRDATEGRTVLPLAEMIAQIRSRQGDKDAPFW